MKVAFGGLINCEMDYTVYKSHAKIVPIVFKNGIIYRFIHMMG